jgi:proteasome assembly chaperone (PAC2) family protein
MEPVRWQSHPRLRRPIMVVAFEGWNDAADAASTAIGHLIQSSGAERFASIDPEEFFDFTATRPRSRLDAELNRSIEWPVNDLFAWSRPDGPHDLVLMSGTEPNLRWRTFCESVVGIATDLGVQMMVSLGALLADVAHTRPVRVTGTAADPDLAERLHLRRSRYEGPTGILGVLSDAMSKAGIPAASLWATVPHYVSQTPSPKAALALLERVSSIIGVPTDALDLQIASSSYERQVTDLVQADPDVAEYVAQLEREQGEQDGITMTPGESLAEEVERFLREHGK